MIQPAVTALVICAAASSSLAHHSHQTFYDPCKPVTIEAEFTGHRPEELFLTLEDPAKPDKAITVPMFPAGEKFTAM